MYEVWTLCSLQQLANSCHSYAKWHFSSLTICAAGKWDLPFSHCWCQNPLLSACRLLCGYTSGSLCGPSLPDSFCTPCTEGILELVKYCIFLSQKSAKKNFIVHFIVLGFLCCICKQQKRWISVLWGFLNAQMIVKVVNPACLYHQVILKNRLN